MNEFTTWDMLINYVSFVPLVYTVVEFTKELPYVKKLPTKYYSAIVSFALIMITQIRIGFINGHFEIWDIMLYAISSITISLSANGLSDFNKKG